jgi:hypothetical protein
VSLPPQKPVRAMLLCYAVLLFFVSQMYIFVFLRAFRKLRKPSSKTTKAGLPTGIRTWILPDA